MSGHLSSYVQLSDAHAKSSWTLKTERQLTATKTGEGRPKPPSPAPPLIRAIFRALESAFPDDKGHP